MAGGVLPAQVCWSSGPALAFSGLLLSGHTPAEVLPPQEGSPGPQGKGLGALGARTHVSSPRPHPHPALPVLGAAGVCRAALGEALLPALLQCVQGPCDHHVWGEAAPPRPVQHREAPFMGSLGLAHRPGLAPSRCPLQWARGGGSSAATPQSARCLHSTPSVEDAP